MVSLRLRLAEPTAAEIQKESVSPACIEIQGLRNQGVFMKPKSVLITGCSSGIGRKTAELLKSKGWRVFATARKPKDIKDLIDSGFESCKLDVEDSSSIKEAVNYVFSKTRNQLDALVNNAGYGLTSAVEDLTREDLRRQFEVNVFGLQELTNLIIPIFRKQRFGRIVNVSSIAGKFSMPYMGAYCASKFALEALSDALRLELSDRNIYVSIIEPGVIKTKFSENALKVFEKLKNKDRSFHSKAYKIIEQGRKNKKKQSFKAPAETVAKKILHALESKKPRIRYLITSKAYFVSVGKKLLPDNLIDFIGKQHLKKYK